MDYLHDINFILQHLPQNYPFCLVDRILDYTPQRSIVCLKNVTVNEEYFVGHFPGQKIMPGVLIGEALAQSCALLGILDLKADGKSELETDSSDFTGKEVAYLAAVNLKFMNPVIPGDQLILKSHPLRSMDQLRAFEVEALVNKATVCKGTIKTTVRKGAAI
ncbi:MAG: 3-hydroxyacyl-ACP dehydratase FabZ [Proteobacteria bacterium]|nr:3-hydroxyacyl-ACP dehydratase FabZ [Pseudomonadota bacterium]